MGNKSSKMGQTPSARSKIREHGLSRHVRSTPPVLPLRSKLIAVEVERVIYAPVSLAFNCENSRVR
jgi:hypothetical protein